jgi:hypothetical protein
VDARPFQDRGPNDSVQTWGVASTGEHSNLHATILSGWRAHGLQNPYHFLRFHQGDA